MLFTQYYLDCLSQASYLIGDETTGRAVVVDPRRDAGEYVRDAAEAGLTIELVLETHFHADFLSGHLEVAAATGAEIAYSAVAETEFESRKLAHGERISLGDVELEIRHTPGHTPESMSIVVWERADDDAPYAVLTGDTLFVGDVGRPDLLSSKGVTAEELAGMLYDSLHQQLLTLPDDTRVYPAHGAGSSCGKNLSSDTWSTIGAQRESNYALAPMTKAEFAEVVTAGQSSPPAYFSYDATLNRLDRALLDEVTPPAALSLQAFDAAVAGGAAIIDGRSPEAFASGHLAGSINVGMGGRFSEFAGSVVPSDVDLVLVVDEGAETEARNRLARIGFDRVVGCLTQPTATMAAHPERVQVGGRVTVAEFENARREVSTIQILDNRNPGEVEQGAIDGAIVIPVGQLPSRLGELDPSRPTIVYCAGGYRSSVGASVLRAAGFEDVRDLLGGYGAWAEAMAAA